MIVKSGYTLRGHAPPCMIAADGHWDGSVEDLVGIVPLDQCLKYTEPRRWRGLWRNEFEGSRFCPAPATECSFASQPPKMWLNYPGGAEPDGKLYDVEFIGRRSMYPAQGIFGHMGMSDHEMIVDGMLSMKPVGSAAPLPVPPPEDWQKR